MPQASIITPAYNAQAYLPVAVSSVLAQNFSDWEMIVVADDSHDYAALLRAQGITDNRIRFTGTGGQGMGPAAARNVAVGCAYSDIIINLDADDSVSANYMELIIPAVQKHGAATPFIRVVDESGKEVLSANPPHSSTLLKAEDFMRFRPTYAPIAYSKSKCKILWPSLHYGEDLIFWMKLLEGLPGIFYVPDTAYNYSYRTGSLSRPQASDTHKIVTLRKRMIDWIHQHFSELPSNADLLIRWLESCNEMEAQFNYQLVGVDIYQKEVSRRLELILKKVG